MLTFSESLTNTASHYGIVALNSIFVTVNRLYA